MIDCGPGESLKTSMPEQHDEPSKTIRPELETELSGASQQKDMDTEVELGRI